MFKTATLICIGLCLVASGAFAETNTQSGSAVTLASSSGLYVRVVSPLTGISRSNSNVCGSAVNTGGVTRATSAVRVGGRVFLTGGRGTSTGHVRMAAVTTRVPRAERVRRPEGLGTLLVRIFGLARS